MLSIDRSGRICSVTIGIQCYEIGSDSWKAVSGFPSIPQNFSPPLPPQHSPGRQSRTAQHSSDPGSILLPVHGSIHRRSADILRLSLSLWLTTLRDFLLFFFSSSSCAGTRGGGRAGARTEVVRGLLDTAGTGEEGDGRQLKACAVCCHTVCCAGHGVTGLGSLPVSSPHRAGGGGDALKCPHCVSLAAPTKG